MNPKKELINYRRRRSRETLEEARLLFEKGKLSGTVNRIYYALFYQVSALLLTKNLSSSKHSGVISLFHREFVKTGKVSKELARFYVNMFEMRQEADYTDFFTFNSSEVKEWLKKAEEFIEAIDSLISHETPE